MSQQFQVFQPVQVTGEGIDAGRAGTVRSMTYTDGTGDEAREMVSVQLDGDTEPKPLAVSDLRAL